MESKNQRLSVLLDPHYTDIYCIFSGDCSCQTNKVYLHSIFFISCRFSSDNYQPTLLTCLVFNKTNKMRNSGVPPPRSIYL